MVNLPNPPRIPSTLVFRLSLLFSLINPAKGGDEPLSKLNLIDEPTAMLLAWDAEFHDLAFRLFPAEERIEGEMSGRFRLTEDSADALDLNLVEQFTVSSVHIDSQPAVFYPHR